MGDENAPVPPPREETDREAIRAALRDGPAGVRELSERVRLPEKAILTHLEHVQKSAKARGERFVVLPAKCAKCGFEFETRERVKKPSRCPECGGERILGARFSIEAR